MLRSSPAVVGDTVYIGSVDGNLYAFDINNGASRWKFGTEGIITSSPTVSEGAVYITSEEPAAGALYKLDATSGGQVWKKQLAYEQQFTGGSDMQGTPTVAAGMVFASANLRSFFGIDASTGDTIWTFTNPSATEFIVSAPIYLEGKLFIIDKFDIACLNATTGDKIWSSYSGDELYVSPSYADNQLYVATSQRRIFVINATDGSKTLAYTTPSASWSSPTPCDGRLFIGCNDWNVYSLTATFTSTAASTVTPPNPQVPDYVYIIAGVIFAFAIAAVGAYAYVKTRKK